MKFFRSDSSLAANERRDYVLAIEAFCRAPLSPETETEKTGLLVGLEEGPLCAARCDPAEVRCGDRPPWTNTYGIAASSSSIGLFYIV